MGEIMNKDSLSIKLEIEPNDEYHKALHALIEADNAFQHLTDVQKRQLLRDYCEIKGALGIYHIFNLYNG